MADMQGQVALVTGGVRGIGLAICGRLAARGVTVAAGYSRDKDTAQSFLETYGDRGASVHGAAVQHVLQDRPGQVEGAGQCGG